MIVRLQDSRWVMAFFPRNLSVNREYLVLAIEGDSYRLLSGDGEHDGPHLYDRRFFEVVDASEPDDWTEDRAPGGQRYTRPHGFTSRTWDDYLDRDSDAVAMVRAYLDRCSPCFWDPVPPREIHPITRSVVLDQLRLLAKPQMQVSLQERLKFVEVTQGLFLVLGDVVSRHLREQEREALRRIDRLAANVREDLGDRPFPPIEEFVKSPVSAELAAVATDALRIFLPDSYLRFLGQPSSRTGLPPTVDDLRRARELPKTACPRRYCWWWHDVTFDWEMPVAEGCTWLESAYAEDKGDLTPCSRCVSSAETDHYEPREPERDGFTEHHFCSHRGSSEHKRNGP